MQDVQDRFVSCTSCLFFVYLPITGKATVAIRRRIKIDPDLPMKEQYGTFIGEITRRAKAPLDLAQTASEG